MTEPPAARRYRFVQWEFPFPLGPDDGRYVLREHAGEDAHHVLVLSTRRAPRDAGRRSRRRGEEPAPPPAEVSIARATLVDAATVGAEEAESWLRTAMREDAAGDTAGAALEWLNTAIRMHRVAASDPYLHEVTVEDALVTRVGYGAGDQVADGVWEAARRLEAPKGRGSRRERRASALRPQERLAALLAGRDAVLACEEMALRARLDLDQGRAREAALQAHLALEAAVVELQAWRELRDLGERLASLDGLRDELAAAANTALQGGLDAATTERVAAGLTRLEAALRARIAGTTY